MASGLDQPVDITHVGDNRLFVVEQAGRIMIIDSTGQVLPTPFLDIRSIVRDRFSEEGLLGLAFHPQFKNLFYVNYINNSGNTQISRFTVNPNDPNLADPNSEYRILSINQPFTNHNGGQLAFGPDGYLYIGTGDGGAGGDPRNSGQDTQSLLGKMLRIDINSNNQPYVIPADNPFVGQAGVRDEIWAIGLRNPWRYSFDPLNGDIWIADVGQNEIEELTRQPGGSTGGENYGWRCYEGSAVFNTNGCNSAANYAIPLFEYTHPGNATGSITGGYVYRGNKHPWMYGFYIFADYETGELWMTQSDSLAGFPTQQVPNSPFGEGISTFGVDHEGEIYVANLFSGKIYRVDDRRTSIGAESLREIATISPNPFEEVFRIQFKQPQAEVEINVLDISGRSIHVTNARNVQSLLINRDNWPQGMYIVEIKAGDKLYRGKLMAR